VAEVEPDDLRADANDSWQVWSLKLADLKTQVDTLTYSRPDFALVPGTDEVFAAFETSLKTLSEYIHTGEEIFEGFARALLDSAIIYMEAEGEAQSEIAAVQREMGEL
jgi:hypothetical protein